MNLKRFFLEKIEQQPSLVAQPPTARPRFMGRTVTLAQEMHEFNALGESLVAMHARQYRSRRPAIFALLKDSRANAHALWDDPGFGAFVTEGFVRRVQSVCRYACWADPNGLDIDSPDLDTLVRLWGGLPHDDAHRQAFGGILAQVAFAFIVCHELAHLGMGHPVFFSDAAPGDGPRAAPGEIVEEEQLRLGSVPASGICDDEGALTKRALEVDADIHGLLFTSDFLLWEQAHLAPVYENGVGPGGALDGVAAHLLCDAERRRAILLIGSFIGLLCLPHFGASLADDDAEYPALPERLLFLFHTEPSLFRNDELVPSPRPCSDALHFAIRLMGLESGQAPDERSASGTTETLNISREQLRRRYGIAEALDDVGHISSHFARIRARLAEIEPTLSGYRELPDTSRRRWFAEGRK